MFAPKPISPDSVPGALAKAERYRLLNEPGEAESICLDILEIDPGNQQAAASLILALTDQIPQNPSIYSNALSAIERLQSSYDRAYYSGIVWERRAKARHHGGGPGAGEYAHEWLKKALNFFDEAQNLRPSGNDDAILRWNACVRYLQANRDIAPRTQEAAEPILSE
jgi:hypothetical protein